MIRSIYTVTPTDDSEDFMKEYSATINRMQQKYPYVEIQYQYSKGMLTAMIIARDEE